MDYDTSKVDEVVLALLHLNAHTDNGVTRAGFVARLDEGSIGRRSSHGRRCSLPRITAPSNFLLAFHAAPNRRVSPTAAERDHHA